jgi:hypothetical protein
LYTKRSSIDLFIQAIRKLMAVTALIKT